MDRETNKSPKWCRFINKIASHCMWPIIGSCLFTDISSKLTNSWSRHGLQLLANRKAPQRQHTREGMGSHTSQGRWISDIKRGKSRASHSQDFTRLHSSQIARPAACLPPTVFIFLSATRKDPRTISEDGDMRNHQ